MPKLLSLLRLKRVWVLLFIVSLFAFVKWVIFPPQGAWHQELTLHIQTPEGPITAASVSRVEFKGANYVFKPIVIPHSAKLTGEAVAAELDGKHLFALIGGLNNTLFDTWRALQPDNPSYNKGFRKLRRQYEPLELPRKFYPRLVTIADVSDPTSVALVDPSDLAATFGPGYALEKITIAATHKPVTTGVVEGVLGWLKQQIPNRLDGSRYEYLYSENRLANSISPYSFSTELSR